VIKIPCFSVLWPCSHCIHFVCVASTALFINVPHHLALLCYSPCVSTYFRPHFPHLAMFCTLHFPHFHHTLSRNIRTLRLCLRHSLHTCTHITKSLFCIPTPVFIDHTLYLHTTQMYHWSKWHKSSFEQDHVTKVICVISFILLSIYQYILLDIIVLI